VNAASGRQYKGVNALYLMDCAARNGYDDNRWVTASDAKKHGFLVKEGERGVILEHWSENKEGKLTVKGYPVFNVSQLNAYIPLPEGERRPDLSRADAMLRRAGTEISPGAGQIGYLDAVSRVVKAKTLEQCGHVHTDDLKELRSSMACTMICQEMRLDGGMSFDKRMKSWAESIRHNPRELFNAARDADKIAGAVLKDMQYERNPERNMNVINWDVIEERVARIEERRQAQTERAEAQRMDGIVADAALIPDGPDSNLPNADLNAEQEAVKSSADKAVTEIKELRSSAASRETRASQGLSENAAALAKGKMGQGVIVTHAQAGRSYSGKVIGIVGAHPDTMAIQRISGNQAVLHRIKGIAAESNITVGADLSITKGRDGKTTVKTREELSKAKENKEYDSMERGR
jgi:antirestriction protein ArdC